MSPEQNILIVRLGAMGDVIHSLPVAAALRQAYPAAHIGWAIEERWAELPDSKMPIPVSLTLLDALHQRWTNLLKSFQADHWKKTLRHPELGVLTLDKMLALYAWHGKHHVAHIQALRDRMGW